MKQTKIQRVLTGIMVLGTVFSQTQAGLATTNVAQTESSITHASFDSSNGEELLFSQGALLPVSLLDTPYRVEKTIGVVITAYNSVPEQTDDTPFITASGTQVRDGIVAANFLPFGTKIRIPSIYGDKIFTVEDRMNQRSQYMVDIWFANYNQARNFGIKTATIEILEM